jgi:hypothetical protein
MRHFRQLRHPAACVEMRAANTYGIRDGQKTKPKTKNLKLYTSSAPLSQLPKLAFISGAAFFNAWIESCLVMSRAERARECANLEIEKFHSRLI